MQALLTALITWLSAKLRASGELRSPRGQVRRSYGNCFYPIFSFQYSGYPPGHPLDVFKASVLSVLYNIFMRIPLASAGVRNHVFSHDSHRPPKVKRDRVGNI